LPKSLLLLLLLMMMILGAIDRAIENQRMLTTGLE
jgi:hypothetical protein